jgi:Four helix bundle sensory module for signal transduction
LLLGFGGLLILLAFTGLNALSVVKTIESRSDAIRLDYVNRDDILQQLRSDIYLSGTHARDLLLEPDQARADLHRNELHDTQIRIDSMIREYGAIRRPEERVQFDRFVAEVASYFESLRPAVQWNAAERRKFGFAFMQTSLLPRRLVIVRLADRLAVLNGQQLETENREVAELFSSFRKNLATLLIGTLILGALLAGASINRVLRLENLSHGRLSQVEKART